MDLKNISLSGSESRFTIMSKNGDKIEVVIYNDGRRGIEYYKKDSKMPSSVVMNEEDIPQIAAVLGGAFDNLKLLEPRDIALKGLILEWIKLEQNASIAGKSLGELRLRETTGVSILAILRGENLRKKFQFFSSFCKQRAMTIHSQRVVSFSLEAIA